MKKNSRISRDCRKHEKSKLKNSDFLDMRFEKKIEDIDNKIEFCKKQLNALLEEESKSEDTVCDTSFALNDLRSLDNRKDLNDLHKEIDIFKKSSEEEGKTLSPKPSNFTNWLAEGKDLDMPKYKNLTSITNLQQISKTSSTRHSSSENFRTSLPSSSIDFRCMNMSLIAEHEVEKLLFKAFVLQNFGKYSTSSDDSDSENIQASIRDRTLKPIKPPKKCFKQNLHRKPRNNKNPHKSGLITSVSRNIEVIDLERNLSLDITESEKENENKSILDLDIESCDWSEPFDLESHTESQFSVMEEIKSPDEKTLNTTIDIDIDTDRQVDNKNCMKSNTNKIIEVSGNGDVKQKIWECPICFEHSVGQEVVTTICGHVFCKICLESHNASISKSCPSCRADLKDQPLITLYNI